MPKREEVPPMRRPRGTDVLIPPTEPASAPSEPAYQKTSVYLRPDQIEWLDTMRAAYRKAGKRTTSASDLMRAAIDLASEHEAELDYAIMESGQGRVP